MYIPPPSVHPPDVLTELVLGSCRRIYTLCSELEDITALLRMFYYWLLVICYSPINLLPLFEYTYHLATDRKTNPNSTLPLYNEEDVDLLWSRIFFRTRYHPTSLLSSTLQQLWTLKIIAPPQGSQLSTETNQHGRTICLEKITVAYSCPPNLEHLLSYRNLHPTIGTPVSSYRIKY